MFHYLTLIQNFVFNTRNQVSRNNEWTTRLSFKTWDWKSEEENGGSLKEFRKRCQKYFTEIYNYDDDSLNNKTLCLWLLPVVPTLWDCFSILSHLFFDWIFWSQPLVNLYYDLAGVAMGRGKGWFSILCESRFHQCILWSSTIWKWYLVEQYTFIWSICSTFHKLHQLCFVDNYRFVVLTITTNISKFLWKSLMIL